MKKLKNIIIVVAIIIAFVVISYRLINTIKIVNNNIKIVEQINTQKAERGLTVFISQQATQEEIKQIGEQIKNIQGVEFVEYKSKEQGLAEFKEQWGDKSYLLEPYEENNILPNSYIVKISDPKLIKQIQEKIEQMEHVRRVR